MAWESAFRRCTLTEMLVPGPPGAWTTPGVRVVVVARWWWCPAAGLAVSVLPQVGGKVLPGLLLDAQRRLQAG